MPAAAAASQMCWSRRTKMVRSPSGVINVTLKHWDSIQSTGCPIYDEIGIVKLVFACSTTSFADTTAPGPRSAFPLPQKDFAFDLRCCRPRLACFNPGMEPSGSTSHLFDPARGTMISYPNSLPAEGGRGLFTRSGIDSTPRGTSGPPCMRTGLEHLPVVESANPHPPQPHR